jgi:putative IMPACT (imprinted ancient) family translation regulator
LAPLESDGARFEELAEPLELRETVKRSHFIACLLPAATEEEVRSKLESRCALHREATHNCWAYRLGPDPLIEYASDAGEPSGTAGRPILGSIRRSGLNNLLVVVTRSLGGVKLGVRGLIDAYGGITARALSAAARRDAVVKREIEISFPFESTGEISRFLLLVGGDAEAVWAYSTHIHVTTRLALENVPQAQNLLTALQARGIVESWRVGES